MRASAAPCEVRLPPESGETTEGDRQPALLYFVSGRLGVVWRVRSVHVGRRSDCRRRTLRRKERSLPRHTPPGRFYLCGTGQRCSPRRPVPCSFFAVRASVFFADGKEKPAADSAWAFALLSARLCTIGGAVLASGKGIASPLCCTLFLAVLAVRRLSNLPRPLGRSKRRSAWPYLSLRHWTAVLCRRPGFAVLLMLAVKGAIAFRLCRLRPCSWGPQFGGRGVPPEGGREGGEKLRV